MNNLASYCGLVDAKKRASDKDLHVPETVDGEVGVVRHLKRQRLLPFDGKNPFQYE